MNDNLIIRPIAIEEIEDAWRWYERQREGLGNEFILWMEESIKKIILTPELYPVVHKNIRRSLIHRFPYGILYIPEKDKIIILGVFHSSRNPKCLKNRI